MTKKLNRPAMALILVMIAVVMVSIIVASIYYRSANKSVDPRIEEARRLYSKYDSYARKGDFYRIFSLLDSIEAIYSSQAHYRDSYETAVIRNNRAAALITLSIYGDSVRADFNPYYLVDSDSLNKLAEEQLLNAVSVYRGWLEMYQGLTEEEILEKISASFFNNFIAGTASDSARYLKARTKEIYNTIAETDRRLSVCYTNLGVLCRQREEYEAAVKYYREALGLWDRNLSAENNLNALFGLPARKRNFLQKLFPPDRDD